MAREDGDGSGGSTVLGFGIGLCAGAILGLGVSLFLATEEGQTLKQELRERAKKLKDDSVDEYRRVDTVVGQWASRGREVAERLQTAASEGLREARKHAAAPRDPRNADLAGVEGIADV
jgi:gas vesicle protein